MPAVLAGVGFSVARSPMAIHEQVRRLDGEPQVVEAVARGHRGNRYGL